MLNATRSDERRRGVGPRRYLPSKTSTARTPPRNPAHINVYDEDATSSAPLASRRKAPLATHRRIEDNPRRQHSAGGVDTKKKRRACPCPRIPAGGVHPDEARNRPSDTPARGHRAHVARGGRVIPVAPGQETYSSRSGNRPATACCHSPPRGRARQSEWDVDSPTGQFVPPVAWFED